MIRVRSSLTDKLLSTARKLTLPGDRILCLEAGDFYVKALANIRPGVEVTDLSDLGPRLSRGTSRCDVIVVGRQSSNQTLPVLEQAVERLNPAGVLVAASSEVAERASKSLIRDRAAGRRIRVFRKSPLSIDKDASFEGERAYGYLTQSDCISNAVALSRQFENPWIFRGIVHKSWRIQDRLERDKVCREILELSRDARDRGAALCVLGYAQMESGEDNSEWWDQLAHWKAEVDYRDPMVLRWLISLLFLAGERHRINGNKGAAHECFESCARLDPIPFSPLLATKTVKSCLRLAELALESKQMESSRGWWKQAVENANAALHASWPDHFGEVETFPPCILKESTEIVALASVASRCLFHFRFSNSIDQATVDAAWSQSGISANTSHPDVLQSLYGRVIGRRISPGANLKHAMRRVLSS